MYLPLLLQYQNVSSTVTAVSNDIFHCYYNIRLYLPLLLQYQTVSSTVTTISDYIFHCYYSIKLYLPRLLQSISLIFSLRVGKCNVPKKSDSVVSCIMLSKLERDTLPQSSVVSDKAECQCAWEKFCVERRAFSCNMLQIVRHEKLEQSSL